MITKTLGIGVDLGGTKLEVGVVDSDGKVVERIRLPTRVKDGPSEIIKDILECIKKLQRQLKENLAGVGLGVAGQIENITGAVRFAPNLKWNHVPLQAELSRALKLPVVVTNDVRAATWGEWLHGAGKGIDDLICLFIGTGIGSGIVSGGHILTGASNAAGEVGHFPINFNGPVCGCGNRGCFEAFAGGWAIARRAKELVKENHTGGAALLELADGNIDSLSAKTVFTGYRQGNPLAKQIFQEMLTAMIAGVTGLVNAFNPKCLIMGGGIIEGMPELVNLVHEGVTKNALKAVTEPLKIIPSMLLKDAGLIGAASLAIRSALPEGGK